MPLPAFTCELHRRVTLAADLQAMPFATLALSEPNNLAVTYGLDTYTAEHIRTQEIEHRA